MEPEYYRRGVALVAKVRAFLSEVERETAQREAARLRKAREKRERESLKADRQKVLAELRANADAPVRVRGPFKTYTARPSPPRGLEGEAREYVKVLRNDPCAYCGGATQHIDHIEPVSKGGGNEWDNLAPACRRCNVSKHNLSLLRFLLKQRDKRRNLSGAL